ncbi:MAG: hypothetical protein FWH20_05110 [Oscillospiraceae bacterium]|nr:hypothetical protein [Oscillospiraceae bacterium]
MQNIERIEKSIARNEHETVIVFDTNGNELFRASQGRGDEVTLTPEQWSRAKGNIVTHNHPFDPAMERTGFENTSAFSFRDIMRSIQYQPAEIRMVVGNEAHSFRWVDPKHDEIMRFLENLREIEITADSNMQITKNDIDEAVEKFTHNQTLENRNIAQNAIIEHYQTVISETDKVNRFIENSQNAGYVFTKGTKGVLENE